jgi:hypothetical protein
MLNKINELRKDFGLKNETKMMVMLSLSTNDMNKYIAMYPEVWFIDCTASKHPCNSCGYTITVFQFVYMRWHYEFTFLLRTYAFMFLNSYLQIDVL